MSLDVHRVDVVLRELGDDELGVPRDVSPEAGQAVLSGTGGVY